MTKNSLQNIVKGLLLLLLFFVCAEATFGQSDQPTPSAGEGSGKGHDTIIVTREQTGPFEPRFTPNFLEVARGVIEQTNKFRKEQKLPPLQQNELLTKIAQDFADYMAKTGRYGHYADERTPLERATAQGYDYCFIGENIGLQFKSNGFATGPLMKAFFQGWKNSPPHRANMLHNGVTETGVAFAQSPETGAYFGVQLVARPRADAIRFEVKNGTDHPISYRIDSERFDLPVRSTRRHTICQFVRLSIWGDGKELAGLQVEPGKQYILEDDGAVIKVGELPER